LKGERASDPGSTNMMFYDMICMYMKCVFMNKDKRRGSKKYKRYGYTQERENGVREKRREKRGGWDEECKRGCQE
jgi:hypothetical protein